MVEKSVSKANWTREQKQKYYCRRCQILKKILAVDDEEDILFTLEAVADVADLNMTTTSRGLKALKYIKNNKFDLLLVDYHMPDINGLKLVKEIRKIDKEIPILVLTVDE